MSLAIVTSGLSRSYKTYKKPQGFWNSIHGFWRREHFERIALESTDLEIRSGEIVGLVGANGAGKTTLLKLLSGLIHPSSGDAKVLGFRPWERSDELLRQISILLGQKNQLWWDIPPADSYELLMDIYEIDKSRARKRYIDLAELLKCIEILNVPLRRLSLGERMKMEIIGSLLHEPKVLFLDEPTIGLDIVAQTSIRDFLRGYVKEFNPTLILTSHYMDDIAKLAKRLLLIQKGKIVYDGTVVSFMKRSKPKKILTVTFEQPLKREFRTGDYVIPPKTSVWTSEISAHELSGVIGAILTSEKVSDVRLEESNFEDVIREFMDGRKV